MVIGIVAIALIIFFTWRAMKKDSGELYSRRMKPKRKLSPECKVIFSQCESLISTIANRRSYSYVLDELERVLESMYSQYEFNKKTKQDDYYQPYYEDLFEKQTFYKNRIWSVWFALKVLRRYVGGLALDNEEMLIKDLIEKYNAVLSSNDCPETFLDAWEEYDALHKRKTNSIENA